MKEFKEFTKYTAFNILSMVGLSVYILADTYFIANGIGADGLAALNLAIPVFSFVNAIGLMLGIGGATKYAISRAQNQKDAGYTLFSNMVYLTVLLGCVMIPAGIFCSRRLASVLGADQVTMEMTSTYIRFILLFSPAFILNNIVNAFTRNDGAPGLAMLAMLAGCLFNIIFDYIFIFPMQLGLLGAVLATGFAPLVGLIVLSVHFIRRENQFGLCRTKPDAGGTLYASSLGTAAFITEVSSGLVIVIYNLLVLRIAGNTGVAAYGIIANISLVVLAIFTGIAQGIQPVISAAYGRGEGKSVRRVLVYGTLTAVFVSAILYFGLLTNADQVASIFNKDKDILLQSISKNGICIYFTGIFFAGINMVLSAYFASIEQAGKAQFVSLMRGVILLIPIVIWMALGWGMNGIWFSFLVTELATLIITAVYCCILKTLRR